VKNAQCPISAFFSPFSKATFSITRPEISSKVIVLFFAEKGNCKVIFVLAGFGYASMFLLSKSGSFESGVQTYWTIVVREAAL
jgi:hypothetical protein